MIVYWNEIVEADMNFLKKLFSKKQSPEIGSVFALNGETDRRKGNLKSALKNFDKAIKLEPQNDMYYASRSLVKKDLKNYKEALKDIEIAISMQDEITFYQKIKEEISRLNK